MSALHAGLAVIVLLAIAGGAFVRGLRRAPASVAAARRSMRGDNARSHAATLHVERAARWLHGRHEDDLVLIGTTAHDVATQMITSGVLMTAIVGLGTGALVGLGVLPGVVVVIAPLAGMMACWTVQRGVVSEAQRRRRDFRRTANDFVQLVAIGLTTDQSVEEAVRFALDVGAGPWFDELRGEVAAAPLRGMAVWEAIDEIGQRFAVRELCEFAASVERQGTQGVAIGDTVASLAAGMRAKALDELEREADRANANLSGPTVGFVVATIVFLAYPLAQRISDAFGG